jgi:site-specific DNA-methyltransferase (adenine-specific)
LIWIKNTPTGMLNAKKMPMKYYEEIAMFYRKLPTYNPIFRKGPGYRVVQSKVESTNYKTGYKQAGKVYINDGTNYYPRDILYFKNHNRYGKLHPTQKPLKLIKYLIKTFSNPGDTVLDCCAGSGTIGAAAQELGRNFILIENKIQYIKIIQDRLFPPPLLITKTQANSLSLQPRRYEVVR